MTPANDDRRPRPRLGGPAPIVAQPPTDDGEWSWRLQGRCRGHPAALFFPEDLRGLARARQEARAKLVCAECPVLARCREHAVTAPETWGVWGATTSRERDVRRAVERE